MSTKDKKRTKDEQGMRISAVSRITGIPTDTLRAWERRYSLVSPRRSDGAGRAYSRDDVQKLSLIKKLIDRGHAISNVAPCSIDELNELLALHDGDTKQGEVFDRPVRLLACGKVLSVTLEHLSIDEPRIETVGLYSSVNAAGSNLDNSDIDVLVLEYASLQEDMLNEITAQHRRSDPALCIIIYAFASDALISKLENRGFVLVRAPVKTRLLLDIVLSNISVVMEGNDMRVDSLDINSEPAKIRFSNEQLAMLSAIDNPLKCECPKHLADLILNLQQFEVYSLDCENRNDKDARVHQDLSRASGHARSILENALQRLIDHEDISLP